MMDEELEFWKSWRDALLAQVDDIERHKMHEEYRTAQLREIGKKVIKRADSQKKQLDIASEE